MPEINKTQLVNILYIATTFNIATCSAKSV